jgi:molecular chaperone HtpG
VASVYNLGGVADLLLFQPTAGREALTTDSMQLLQLIVSGVDQAISEDLSNVDECDSSTAFMEWVRRHGRYEMCGRLQAQMEPGHERVQLRELSERSRLKALLVYAGSDAEIVRVAASEDSPLILLASGQPRRQCEQSYLELYCETESVTDAPTVLSLLPIKEWSTAQQALTFRIATILATDYFLDAEVLLGTLSHGLPMLVEPGRQRARLIIDPAGQTFAMICTLYGRDYEAFGSMTKDFVRNVVFPRVADLVPSSTRQGAEAFLQTIRRTKDIFEYEYDDIDSLAAIWERVVAGLLSVDEAAARSTAFVGRNVQVLDSATAMDVKDVVPDVMNNEAAFEFEWDLSAAPPIMRPELSSEAKLLTIDSSEAPLKGYRCFIALSDRAREEKGEFFLQPHSTSIVWGGQKVLFVFEHHSGEFGLYYDLQTSQVVSTESGGRPFPTATIVLDNTIFIPVPSEIADAFIPAPGERRRFEVRSDLLFTERQR